MRVSFLASILCYGLASMVVAQEPKSDPLERGIDEKIVASFTSDISRDALVEFLETQDKIKKEYQEKLDVAALALKLKMEKALVEAAKNGNAKETERIAKFLQGKQLELATPKTERKIRNKNSSSNTHLKKTVFSVGAEWTGSLFVGSENLRKADGLVRATITKNDESSGFDLRVKLPKGLVWSYAFKQDRNGLFSLDEAVVVESGRSGFTKGKIPIKNGNVQRTVTNGSPTLVISYQRPEGANIKSVRYVLTPNN